MSFRAGYVALIGRPNVGKSTLLNRLLGQKIAAATPKPQTTRKNLLAILHPENGQVALVDTPGHHQAKGPLNKFMVREAEQALLEVDVVAYVVEARADNTITPGNEPILRAIQETGKPVVLILNKVDAVKQKDGMLLQLERYQGLLGEQFVAAHPVSATRGIGLDALVNGLRDALPEGPPLFDEEAVTDESERELVAELIREQIMLQTGQEIPYSSQVVVEAFDDARPKGRVKIIATIHLERDSQKGIVIGKKGARLKEIGTRARATLERFLESKVFLDLHVSVTPDWTEKPNKIAELGLRSKADTEL